MTKLEAALDLVHRGFKIFPLKTNSKVPLFSNWQTKATNDVAQIEKWFTNKEYNIAILTEDLLVLDVDLKNEKNGYESLEKLLKENGLHLPVTFAQKTPTGGCHHVYRVASPARNTSGELGEGLDTRGLGGYVAAIGSTLDGHPYLIEHDAPVINAPDWLVERTKKTYRPAVLPSVDVDRDRALKEASEYLASLELCTEGKRNATAFKVAAKLKDIGLSADDNLALLVSEWKCEPELDVEELQTCVRSAYRNGGQGSASPEAKFPALSEEEKAPVAKNPFEKLNETYALVMMGASHRILEEGVNEHGLADFNYLKEESFHKKLASEMFQDANGNMKPLSQAWIRHPQRRTYDKVLFAPGENLGPRFYNTWKGFAFEPLKEGEEPSATALKAVRDFEHHILENICHGDFDLYDWLYSWMAHLIQKPQEKPGVAIVLKGEKGTGKNVFSNIVGHLFPANYVSVSGKRYLIGNFNAHLENLLMITLDEAFWSGDKTADSILKELVTERKMMTERKGLEAKYVDNRLRVVILGNEQWLVPASEDERRYAVFNVGTGNQRDRDFFLNMIAGMKKGGHQLLLTKLMKYDLHGKSPEAAPNTEALQEQKIHSLSPLSQWWFDSLNQGYIEGIDFTPENPWPSSIDKGHLRTVINKYMQSRNISQWGLSESQLVEEIRKLCGSLEAAIEGGRVAYKIPTAIECRNYWEKRNGFKTKWLVPLR